MDPAKTYQPPFLIDKKFRKAVRQFVEDAGIAEETNSPEPPTEAMLKAVYELTKLVELAQSRFVVRVGVGK